MSRKTLLLVGILLAVGAAVFPTLSYSTNCGGNSAALGQVCSITLVARTATFDAPDHSFRFTSVDSKQREHLSLLSRTHWLRGARFLVSTTPVSEHETQPRRVIAVCDTPYRNVPRRWIASAPPTHAAGFADGSHGLVSTAEFAALDRSTFTPLDELYPQESK
jgi:hypothetical protein